MSEHSQTRVRILGLVHELDANFDPGVLQALPVGETGLRVVMHLKDAATNEEELDLMVEIDPEDPWVTVHHRRADEQLPPSLITGRLNEYNAAGGTCWAFWDARTGTVDLRTVTPVASVTSAQDVAAMLARVSRMSIAVGADLRRAREQHPHREDRRREKLN